MLDFIKNLSRSGWYWAGLVVWGLALEGTALYYQYALDQWPCVLCIHVRIWVMGVILVSLLAIAAAKKPGLNLFFHVLNTLMFAGLVERSYILLGTERGFVFGSCVMDLGLPSWFALDKWFPKIFEVWASCGYTPELVFGITMAEALMVMSVLLFIFSLLMVVLSIKQAGSPRG